jgi:hypothetical protein
MRRTSSLIEAKVKLDTLASIMHNNDVRFTHIIPALKRELAHDSSRLDVSYEQLDKLREPHERFLRHAGVVKQQEERIQETIGLLGPSNISREDITDAVANEAFMSTRIQDLRDKLQVWRAIYRVLSALDQPEAQAADIRTVLGWLGIDASRQSIEAAVAAHKDVFAVRKDGRKRFISLKGA